MPAVTCIHCGKQLPPDVSLCHRCQDNETPPQPSNNTEHLLPTSSSNSFPPALNSVVLQRSAKQRLLQGIFLAGTLASIANLFIALWTRLFTAYIDHLPTTSDPLHLHFETGDLSSWTAEGRAFIQQPVAGDKFKTRQIKPDLVPLGGDYWDGPYPVGNHGNYWISTDNELTGTLTSKEFTINQQYPWFSFLIGGSADMATCRVELLVKATLANTDKFAPAAQANVFPLVTLVGRGNFYRVFQATGHNTEIMRRVVQNVAWLAGERARIRIVDTSTRGHINVDDFRFSAEAPQVLPQEEGGGDPTAPVWGFADIHTHPMAHLAFGGNVFWGKQDEPMETALGWCTPSHGPGGTGIFTKAGILMSWFEQKGHGTEIGHCVGGYPLFDGWPKFTTLIHQQMHVDWVKRAYEGGLRLIVALAVNNEMLAKQFGGQQPYDDKSAVELQIGEMKRFAERHADWTEIAYSPADARRIIRQNKLAIVLGIEVDSLGNFGDMDTCSNEEVLTYLRHLYHDLGVRHLFPIHLANNAFGGSALYNELFNVVNYFLRKRYFQVKDGSAHGFQFRLGDDSSAAITLSRLLTGYRPPSYAKYPGGHINVSGLTPRGRFLIQTMMSLGMIIDVDHMSYTAIEETLDIVEKNNYPLSCGHTGFAELAWKQAKETINTHKCAHEGLKTAKQLERMRKLGGIVAPIANQGDIRSVSDIIPALKGKVLNDSAGSSKTWAQAYLYAVKKMGGRGVGMGTDINGFARLPGPRFGLNASYNLDYGLPQMKHDTKRRPFKASQVVAQKNGVRYHEPIKDAHRYRFEGVLQGDIYNDMDRDIWQAIALYKAGLNPWIQKDIPDAPGRVINFAKGFWAEQDEQLLMSAPGSNAPWEQRAAFLVKTNQHPGTSSRDPQPVHAIYPRVLFIWQRWQAMEGPNIPLKRSFAGQRDFDINIDGVAHYGMLPDFLQDLKNVGLTEDDLLPLFRSAEDYIRTWEKCECRSQSNTSFTSITPLEQQERHQSAEEATSEELIAMTAKEFVKTPANR